MINEFTTHEPMNGHAKDNILDESSFVGRQTDTNFVVHIGFYSVLRQHKVHIENV